MNINLHVTTAVVIAKIISDSFILNDIDDAIDNPGRR